MIDMEAQGRTLPTGQQAAGGGMNADAITAWLRGQIEQGVYKPGDVLPRNADLIEETGASNTTVSKAISNLKAEGLITGRKGQRPRVTDSRVLDYRVTDQTRPAWLLDVEHQQDMFTASTAARGGSKKLDVQRIPAPEHIAVRLGIEPGADVIRRRVVQSVDGRVIATETAHYPLPLAEELGLDSPEDIKEGTTRRIGNSRHRDTGWLTETVIRPATPEEQQLFAVVPGTSLLQLTTTSANGHHANAVAVRVLHPTGVRVVHELGDESGLDRIRRNRKAL